jgi:hypothetical protein
MFSAIVALTIPASADKPYHYREHGYVMHQPGDDGPQGWASTLMQAVADWINPPVCAQDNISFAKELEDTIKSENLLTEDIGNILKFPTVISTLLHDNHELLPPNVVIEINVLCGTILTSLLEHRGNMPFVSSLTKLVAARELMLKTTMRDLQRSPTKETLEIARSIQKDLHFASNEMNILESILKLK